MKIQIHSITIKATILPDDWDSSQELPDPSERTFKHEDLSKLPGIITDIFSLAKRYLFHNADNHTLSSQERDGVRS